MTTLQEIDVASWIERTVAASGWEKGRRDNPAWYSKTFCRGLQEEVDKWHVPDGDWEKDEGKVRQTHTGLLCGVLHFATHSGLPWFSATHV